MAYILSAKRTPIGSFQGQFSKLSATQLGSEAIKAALNESQLSADDIKYVFMGNVLNAGLGQAPAKQAAIGASLNKRTPCTLINKVCGSGMESIIIGGNSLSDDVPFIVAGGMESMTNAPYLLPNARAGERFGHGKIVDHMLYDGLEDPYHDNAVMGLFADKTASKFGFSREEQDEFVVETISRAKNAESSGLFDKENVKIFDKNNVELRDEPISKARPEKISKLKPAFSKDGTVTAATSSSIADGAAAVILAHEGMVESSNMKPIARIIGTSNYSQEPQWFTIAPIGAIRDLMEKVNWSVNDVDAFEINEAFACVAMASMKEIKIPRDKLNMHGGACAMGHPLGASGARIVVTLINVLKSKGLKRGIASTCIGGGEATAIAIEICN